MAQSGAMIEDVDSQLDEIIDGFVPSSPITDPEIAFDQCKTIAFEFMIHAASQGVSTTLVQLAGYEGDLNSCHPEWLKIERRSIIHYVVRISDMYVDWTKRQFDPLAAVPTVFMDPEAEGWMKSWEIANEDLPDWPREALDDLLSTFRMSLPD
jgi:hypothetical protein